jgi:hypothetical protein
MNRFAVASAALLLALSGAPAIHAEGLKPLSAEDKARVDTLLKSFDPASYDFHYQYQDAKGKVQRKRVGKARLGLASVRQGETVKAGGNVGEIGGEKAGTNTIINIFKQAGTNTTINIFKQAADNTVINIFKEAGLNTKAQELNSILQKYAQ